MNPFSTSLCLATALCAQAALAADWPQWRGPNRNGISAESGWNARWSTAPKVLWKANVGTGFASFTVAHGKVYTTGNADNKDTVFCFDATTGKEIWKHAYDADLGDKYFEGGTTGTPAVDGDKLYQLSRWGDVFCFEAATGKIVWSKNVQKETDARIPDWGFGGSPLVWKNLLILNVGQGGLALEKTSGKIVWESDDRNAGYSTPYPIERNGKTEVILGSGRSYVAVDPANGQKLWEHPWNTSYGVNAADPVAQGDLVFISSGYNKGAALLETAGSNADVVWQSRVMRNQMNPSVLIDGHLYGIDGNEGKDASLKCIEFSTGTEKWSEKSAGAGSVTVADGKLIVLSEKGELIIAEASKDAFKPLSRAQVLSGRCWTVPVLANGRIYCRNAAGDVVCLDVKG
ncbi:PQQ-like beta-propeller repeat protein [Verrucomicrobium spinosum]|uniref:PQQ-like beta-propeller repeat protein n=1 Tax=Verrucomicrobium spinosum TaxID=2736 RepID=UPI000174585C|nr:PQQ-like beta-propeller repeat protein [Verrucomicrobium spinosum]